MQKQYISIKKVFRGHFFCLKTIGAFMTYIHPKLWLKLCTISMLFQRIYYVFCIPYQSTLFWHMLFLPSLLQLVNIVHSTKNRICPSSPNKKKSSNIILHAYDYQILTTQQNLTAGILFSARQLLILNNTPH